MFFFVCGITFLISELPALFGLICANMFSRYSWTNLPDSLLFFIKMHLLIFAILLSSLYCCIFLLSWFRWITSTAGQHCKQSILLLYPAQLKLLKQAHCVYQFQEELRCQQFSFLKNKIKVKNRSHEVLSKLEQILRNHDSWENCKLLHAN